jgi:hypothetical protein
MTSLEWGTRIEGGLEPGRGGLRMKDQRRCMQTGRTIWLTAAGSRRLTIGYPSSILSIFFAGLRLGPGPREVFGGRVKEK